jgi:hypothetical protein
VRKKRFDNYSEAEWDIIELEATAEQLKAVTDFWELTRGQSYDWVGMVLSHILPFRIKRIDKWYCSEWVAYALGVSGIIDWRKMRLYSCGRLPPSFLYNVIACHKQGA